MRRGRLSSVSIFKQLQVHRTHHGRHLSAQFSDSERVGNLRDVPSYEKPHGERFVPSRLRIQAAAVTCDA